MPEVLADLRPLGGRDATPATRVRLDLNTGPEPPGFAARLSHRLAHLDRYGSERADLLRARICEVTTGEPEPDQVVLGAGSMDLLRLATAEAVAQGATIITQTPGYSGYRRLAHALGATLQQVPRHADGSTNGEGLLQQVLHTPRCLVALNHPVNPTGALEDLSVVDALLGASQEAVVLVDEAYVEFESPAATWETSRFAGDDRLIVTRTFSKGRGLAGIRLGYAITGTRRAQRWRAQQLPGAISALTQAAGLVSLEEQPAQFTRRMGQIVAARQRLAQQIATGLGREPLPSHANFLFLPLGAATQTTAAVLASAGFAVRSVLGEPGLHDGLRITIADADTMQSFAAALISAGVPHDQH